MRYLLYWVGLITARGYSYPYTLEQKRLYPDLMINFGSEWTRLRQTVWPIFPNTPSFDPIFDTQGRGRYNQLTAFPRALDALCLQEAPSSSHFNMQAERIEWNSLSRSPVPTNDRVSSALSPNPPIHRETQALHWLMLTKFPLSKKKCGKSWPYQHKDFLSPSDHSLVRLVTLIYIIYESVR